MARRPTKPEGGAFEPLPLWDQAQQTWQWAWELHWAGYGTVFALLALYALWSLLQLVRNSRRRRKPLLSLAISSLLFVFGTSRALFLFINPYESQQCFLPTDCPVMLTRILFGIALPCITASFSLIQLVFLQLSKLKLYPEKLQNAKFVTCLVAFHFVLALFTEVMITLYVDWSLLNIVCQSFSITLSLILSGSFIYSGKLILKSIRETQLSLSQLGNQTNQERRLKVSKLVKITFIAVFVGFVSCALQLYSIFALYQLHKDDKGAIPKPWPWYIFQSLYRAVDLVAGGILVYVGSRQNSRRPSNVRRFFRGHQLTRRITRKKTVKYLPQKIANSVRGVQLNDTEAEVFTLHCLQSESTTSLQTPNLSNGCFSSSRLGFESRPGSNTNGLGIPLATGPTPLAIGPTPPAMKPTPQAI